MTGSMVVFIILTAAIIALTARLEESPMILGTLEKTIDIED